jgi:RHS repeat-associated protein
MDHLGRPEAIITNEQKPTTVWRALLFAFNRQVISDQIGGYHLGFPGQYHDEETGFIYNNFRDYDPATGRYLQADPIGLAGGLNLYGYANQGPTMEIDPTGEFAFVPILLGAAAGVVFDYALEAYMEGKCSCERTPLGPIGNAAAGAAIGGTGPFASKPRTGIAGGGPSGSSTSSLSQLNHAAAQSGMYSRTTRNAVTSVLRKVPYAGAAIAGYQLYAAASCD